jgi:hypothetical protein
VLFGLPDIRRIGVCDSHAPMLREASISEMPLTTVSKGEERNY